VLKWPALQQRRPRNQPIRTVADQSLKPVHSDWHSGAPQLGHGYRVRPDLHGDSPGSRIGRSTDTDSARWHRGQGGSFSSVVSRIATQRSAMPCSAENRSLQVPHANTSKWLPDIIPPDANALD